MKTSFCHCGTELFFENTECLNCGSDVGFCQSCHEVTFALQGEPNRCGNCDEKVYWCDNRIKHGVCNTWVAESCELCRCCQLTKVIPDLSVRENLERWRSLEVAKRRVLLSTPYLEYLVKADTPAKRLPLIFEFKSGTPQQPVATGYSQGCITINLKEADPIEREKSRVQLGEPQRTLVGHFRHELGHYVWESVVKVEKLDEFRAVFGHESDPPYEEAKQRYYAEGARGDWWQQFVSEYATMHPWEDFAESFGAVLDMLAVVETAAHFQMLPELKSDSSSLRFERLLKSYQRVGVVANELNRDMGLLDLVPEVFSAQVRQKLQFVHQLLSCEHDSQAATL